MTESTAPERWTAVEGVRPTVLVDDTDTWHHRPVDGEIVHRAHAAGLAGAPVLSGAEGYGVHQPGGGTDTGAGTGGAPT